MSQNQTRQQVAEYLTQHGPLEDAKGRATAKLMEALGYEGPVANFAVSIQVPLSAPSPTWSNTARNVGNSTRRPFSLR
jgi:hypothetical protein